MYCIEVCGGPMPSFKDVLIKIQRKIVRAMVSVSYNAHTPLIYITLSIMTFDNI